MGEERSNGIMVSRRRCETMLRVLERVEAQTGGEMFTTEYDCLLFLQEVLS